MNWLINLIIEIQRWNYRRKQRKGKKHDTDKMIRAIRKAEQLSKKAQKRLWVIKIAPGDYAILTKPQVKAFFRNIGAIMKINFYQTNEYVIHITKKPE